MNHFQYPKSPIGIKWWFAACLLFLGNNTFAQAFTIPDYNNPQQTYADVLAGKVGYLNFVYDLAFDQNDYSVFYIDTTGTEHKKFSTITAFDYRSNDTIPQHEKLAGKCIMKYNNKGQRVYAVFIDSTGKITDSLSIKYNRAGQKTSIIAYASDSVPLRKISDEFYTWDSKNNLVTDSTWKLSGLQLKQEASMTKYSYDKNGNVILLAKIEYEKDKDFIPVDTTLEFSKYDNNENLTWYKTISLASYEKAVTIAEFDTMGNETQETTYSPGDTVFTKYMYAGNKLGGLEKYENGQLNERTKIIKQPGGDSVCTDEIFGTDAGTSCPNNSKTVTVYDSHRNELSETTVSTNNGITTTSKIIHKYTFYGTKILIDSTITTDESQYHFSRSLSITINSYDGAGNLTECQEQGDETADKRTKWAYNRQNKVTRQDNYFSCLDTPTESDITTYYTNGTSIKEQTSVMALITSSVIFNEEGRFEEFIYKSSDSYKEVKYVYTK